MKNLFNLFVVFVFGIGMSYGAGMATPYSAMNSRSFIFSEGDITFSVFQDGEFDFYLNNSVGFQAGFSAAGTAITFNSGFNYNPYVQYDDFGAVIQIAQLPVYYDNFGRVNQIGNIRMSYRNGRLYRLGGMRIYYNGYGYYNYHVGYVNSFNRFYVYQPFHRYFVRPLPAYCMVYPQPYRHYYYPVRYTYYRPYHNNVRRAYAHVGRPYQYQSRPERSRVYKNDRRVVARNASKVRSNTRSIAANRKANRTIKSTRAKRSSSLGTRAAIQNRGNGIRKGTIASNRSQERLVKPKGQSSQGRNTKGNRTSVNTGREKGRITQGRTIASRTANAKKVMQTRKVSSAKPVRKETAMRGDRPGRTSKSTGYSSDRKLSQNKRKVIDNSKKAKRSELASRSLERQKGRSSRRGPRD